jgi:hypothetical protein
MTTRAEVQAALLDIAKACADRAKLLLGGDDKRGIPEQAIDSLIHTAKAALEASTEPALVVNVERTCAKGTHRCILAHENSDPPKAEAATETDKPEACASETKKWIEEWAARPWLQVFGGTPENNPALRNNTSAYAEPETKTIYFGFALPDRREIGDEPKPAS